MCSLDILTSNHEERQRKDTQTTCGNWTRDFTSSQLFVPPPILYSFQCYISRDVLSCFAQCIDCFNIHSPNSVFVCFCTPQWDAKVFVTKVLWKAKAFVLVHILANCGQKIISIYICMCTHTWSQAWITKFDSVRNDLFSVWNQNNGK